MKEDWTRSSRSGWSQTIVRGVVKNPAGIEAPLVYGSARAEWGEMQKGTLRHAEFAMRWTGVTATPRRSGALSAPSKWLGFLCIAEQILLVLNDKQYQLYSDDREKCGNAYLGCLAKQARTEASQTR